MPWSHLKLTHAAYHTACNKTGGGTGNSPPVAYLCLKSLFLTEDRRAGNRRKNEVLAAGLEALLVVHQLDSNGTEQRYHEHRLSSYDTDRFPVGYDSSLTSGFPGTTATPFGGRELGWHILMRSQGQGQTRGIVKALLWVHVCECTRTHTHTHAYPVSPSAGTLPYHGQLTPGNTPSSYS